MGSVAEWRARAFVMWHCGSVVEWGARECRGVVGGGASENIVER